MNGVNRTRPLTVATGISRYLRACFRVDTRSLALFRISVAVLIIADVLLRSRNFSFYYTDDGVVPQEVAQAATAEHAISIFYLTSDPTIIAALFVVHVLVALQLLVGYKTRIATLLAFLFVVSLDHHNPFVLSYADTLFRLLLFWAIFLPLGERWAVDAVHRQRAPRETFLGIATGLALGQMVFMYTLNGIHKYPSDLWRSGEAAILVMGLDEMTFLLGNYTRDFPTLLQIGGWLWFHMLLVSVLLILLRGRKRLVLLGLFFGGHLSFAITVRIGAFAFVAIAGLMLFVPSQFWKDGASFLHRVQDGVAMEQYRRLCNRLAGVAESFPRAHLDGENVQILRETGYRVAVVGIVIALGIFLVVLLPEVSLLWEDNVTMDQHPDNKLEEHTVTSPIFTAATSLGVHQPSWSIFAGPDPRTTDRYYVFAAETVDGETYDIFNDRELTYERPGQQLQKQHDTYRQRFYMNSIRRSGHRGQLPGLLAEYYCEKWSDERGIELARINFYEIPEEVTLETVDDPAGRERSANLRSRHACGDHDESFFERPGF